MELQTIHAVRQIVLAARSIDFQANSFCQLMVGEVVDSKSPNDGAEFRRIAEDSTDLYGMAHHKKFFAKYSHRIRKAEGGSILLGRYEFFLFKEDRAEPILLDKTPFCAFDFNAEGRVEQDEDLTTSVRGPFVSDVRLGFIALILSSLHNRLTD
jgi:hypothetical protein